MIRRFLLYVWYELGLKLWKYIVVHAEGKEKEPYGITFTDDKNWWKKTKRDMSKKEDKDEQN